MKRPQPLSALTNRLPIGAIILTGATLACSSTKGHVRAPTDGATMEAAPPVTTDAHDRAVTSDNADAFDAAKRRLVVETLAHELEATHVIPELGAKLAAGLRQHLQSDAYAQATSAPALAALLTAELQAASADKHLNVFFSTEPPPPPSGGPPPPELVAEVRKLNGGVSKIEIFEGNVGYLQLHGVPLLEGSRDAIAAAFARLHDTDALIIDNRHNRGGDPRTVTLYLSYLSEGPPFVFNRIHWREGGKIEEFATADLGSLGYGRSKPVYVLTSRMTFSGGEGLSYHLQAMKRAVIIGETTAGGARRAQVKALGHDLYAMIPHAEGRSTITDGNWEGTGVQPDVQVPAERALDEALRLLRRQLPATKSLSSSSY